MATEPSLPSLFDLAALSQKIFSCKEIAALGDLFVHEFLKFIPGREVILDVNSYDFSRPPLFSWNLQNDWARRYNKEFHILNPSTSALRRLTADGLPIVRRFEDLCREPLEETKFFQQYMQPQRHRYSLIACQILQKLGGTAPNFQVLLIRYDTDLPFSDQEIAYLQLMLPTLAQTTQRIMKDDHAWATSVLRNAFHLPPKLADVASLIVSGHSNKDIAELLGITVGTVKHYAHQIFELTGTATRSDLCRIVLG